MRTHLDCVSCFVRQALDASRMVTDDAAVHERVVRETLRLVVEMPFDRSPPWLAQRVHRFLREVTGNPDPYREAKRRSNAVALALYPQLKQEVRSATDSFATALVLAIAGNMIDFGCRSEIPEDDIRQAIAEATTDALDHTAVDALRRAVGEAREILYLADNAGEIVFDRLLIEELPRERLTLAVRGSPVINDATREDAEVAGLDALVPVIDNGNDAPGTILESCSRAFRDRFARSDLVIAKGQGNYETLSGKDGPIVFLFKAKCPVIAQDVGCALGALIVSRNAGH